MPFLSDVTYTGLVQLLETGVVDFSVDLAVVGRDVVGVALVVVGRCVVAVRLGVLCSDVSLDGVEASGVAAAVLSDAGSNRYPAANDAAANDATSPVTNSSRCVPNLLSQAFTRSRRSSLHLKHPGRTAATRKLAIFLTRIADRQLAGRGRYRGILRAPLDRRRRTRPPAYFDLLCYYFGAYKSHSPCRQRHGDIARNKLTCR